MIDTLDVYLWNKKVGSLISAKSGYRRQFYFVYDADFVKSGLDIAPLRASISGVAAQRGLPIYPDEDKLFGGLPSFISDSLPDHWGNLVFFEWAKAHGIKKKDITPLDMLAYIGRRGMGALEFIPPADIAAENPFKVEIAELSEFAKKAMTDAKDFHAKLSPTLAIESLFKVGTSAGGKRPKAVININKTTGECYSGQVEAPEPGFTPAIIKFDEHSDVPATRIEYSYYLMAKAAGLSMMPSELIECGKEVHFLTERFDRKKGEKIHVQTLAAMRPLASSYEDLLDTAQSVGILPDGLTQLLRQMVINILAANIDDHTKNFSFIMDRSGIWKHAPIYDFTFTVDPSAPSYVNRHSISVNGKVEGISREDLLTVAERFNIKGARAIIDKTAGIVSGYRQYAEEAGVPELWIRKIEAEIAYRLNEL